MDQLRGQVDQVSCVICSDSNNIVSLLSFIIFLCDSFIAWLPYLTFRSTCS